jgi:hypothetical protein
MYQKVITPRTSPVITPEQLAAWGKWQCPQKYETGTSPLTYTDDYSLLLTFIEAATDEVETLADTACLNEQVVLTFDYFPGQENLRSYYYEVGLTTPWWWGGHRAKDSIEPVRRPVLAPAGDSYPLTVAYNTPDGSLQTLDPSTYTVGFDKITLNVGCVWPVTDRRRDCVQVTYWTGHPVTPARLIMAVYYLAQHFVDVRQLVSIDPTSEVGMTLCKMLSSYRSMRIPY